MLSSLAPQDDAINSYKLQSLLSRHASHNDLTWINHHSFWQPTTKQPDFLASRVPSSSTLPEKTPQKSHNLF